MSEMMNFPETWEEYKKLFENKRKYKQRATGASDLINRQDAIDAFDICDLTPDGGVDINDALEILKNLPSAEPEIIRCKDCKYNASSHKCLNPDGFFLIPKDDDFCSYAERGKNE